MPDRILVVDDDPALLSLETAILEAHGFAVTAAEGGAAAIERLKQGDDFDVLVTDLDMPGKGGMDVLEAAREHAPDTVSVMCTSHGRVEVAVQSLKAGAFDFIQKPFAFDHFVSVVQRAVEHRRLRDQTNIYRAVNVVFTTMDPQALPQLVVETASRVLQSDFAAVYLAGPDGFAVAQSHGAVQPGAALLAAIQALCPDVARSDEAMRLPGDAKAGSPHAMARALKSGKDVLGVLWVLRSAERHGYGPRDVDNIGVLAAQTSLAVANARLVSDLRGRILAMEKARQRIYTSSRIEGIGKMAIDVAQKLQNPVQYMRSNLREIAAYLRQQHPDGGGLLDDEITLHVAEERLQAAFDGLARVDEAVSDLGAVAQNRENQKFELGQAIALAVRLARLRFEPEVEVPVDAVIEGAPGQIAQALVALLVNADQALEAAARPRIRVHATLHAGTAVVTVDDNGEGIAGDVLPLVFQPFFSTRGRDGLGLNTARDVIEHHRGTLEIKSQPGLGTRVVIRFPAEPVEDELAFGE